MSFEIRKHTNKPRPRYVTIQERSWLVANVTVNNSGTVCLHLEDPVRFDKEIWKLDTLDELLKRYDL